MLPPERRLGQVMELIEEGRYFTLSSGRQTGKPTSARWLVRHHNKGDRFRALWVDIQTAREQPDPARAFTTLLNELDSFVQVTLPDLGVPAERPAFLQDPATAVL